MKRLILIVVILFNNVVWSDTIDLNVDYTAEMLFESALTLEEKYPDIIDVVTLGFTQGNRPIFVVRMTSNVGEIENKPESYVEKYHNFIEGGLHSRENVAPPIIMETIELYAIDYYNDDHVVSINMKDVLDDFVFHFVPISNPDGYNLSSFGFETVPEDLKSQVASFPSKNYSLYKSNLSGVDLNRNFPGNYFDVESKTWKNIWNKEHNLYQSYIPGSAFYFGRYEASEIETQLLMAYMLKYDFRNYLSYHSKGEVIYYHKWMLSELHNAQSKILATLIGKYTGYEPVYTDRKGSSSGYSTDFTAMQTLKPSITIETVHYKQTLPVSNFVIKAVFDEMNMVPIIAAYEGRRIGYHPYRIYVDNIYVRDFAEKSYADAYVLKYGGQLMIGEGRPEYYLPENEQLLKREHMIRLIMPYMPEVKTELTAFVDTTDEEILAARALGIVSGYNNYFRPNDMVSAAEGYVVLQKAFYPYNFLPSNANITYEVSWAEKSVRILFDHEVLDYKTLTRGKISIGDFKSYLSKVTGGIND